MTSFRVLWNAHKRKAAGLTKAELDAVFNHTAANFYLLQS